MSGQVREYFRCVCTVCGYDRQTQKKLEMERAETAARLQIEREAQDDEVGSRKKEEELRIVEKVHG